ncbi:MAG: trypsin-like peptidase domain-containing protein [SAR324 cluster bacterium]|nr:trypsin-like peptidase domain-containing protein [SAR324 cluster bacterium]
MELTIKFRKWIFVSVMSLLFLPLTHDQAASAQMNASQVYKSTSNAVVLLMSFNKDNSSRSKGTGSIIKNGHVLTNAHVILDEQGKIYKNILVFLRSENLNDETGRLLENGHQAKVVRFQKELDLALLFIKDLPEMDPIPIGDSQKLSIGDPVLAIGHPENGGLWSLTSGRIGSVIQNFEKVAGKHVFQTEASLNRGNSGGPLLNYQGQLIGVNTSIAREASDGMIITGINFSVQSNVVHSWLTGFGFHIAVPAVAALEKSNSIPPSSSSITIIPKKQTDNNLKIPEKQKLKPLEHPEPKRPEVQTTPPPKIDQDSAPTEKNKLLTPVRPFKDEGLFQSMMEHFEKRFDLKMEKEYESIDQIMENTFNSF